MYIQFVGLDNSVSSRTYHFHVIDPPCKTREFTVLVRSEEFGPGRLKFQDGPGICSARLQRELKGETPDSRAGPDLRIEEQDVREFRARHYPQAKFPKAKATDAVQGDPFGSLPPERHFQNRGYSPLGPTRLPQSEDISTLLLHELGNSLDGLKRGLEGQSVKVCCATTCQEALPLLTGPNPPHLVFTQPELRDGTWADVVSLATKACKPVDVIVVGRLSNVGLYLQTITGGAFDFIVPPLSGYELTHVVRCAIENVLRRREAQTRPA
jgi:ActR/RegA family two-component response regulator